MLRFDFACSRKMRPSMIFKQPTEKRKNAETIVKASTWWERIVAPMSVWNIPSAPRPNSEPRTGKKTVEEGHRPRNFRQQEENELEGDEETVENCPEDTCRLIGNGTVFYVTAGFVIRT